MLDCVLRFFNHVFQHCLRKLGSGLQVQTMFKDPQRRETFCPKVEIIWLIDLEKIGGKKFFDLGPRHEVSVRV